jgi:hypothetical protein
MATAAKRAPRDRDDLSYHRRNWAVQRAGGALMALAVVAGLFGALGSGPLSRRERTAGAFRIRYDRVIRLEAPATWELTLPSDRSGILGLELEQELLRGIEIRTWSLPPARVAATPEGQRVEFATASPDPAVIRMQFIPTRLGVLRTSVRGGTHAIDVVMLVLP